MSDSYPFKATKYLPNGAQIILEGEESDLNFETFSALNPLLSNEMLLVELADDVSPIDVARLIEISTSDHLDEPAATEHSWREKFGSDLDTTSLRGQTVRAGSVTQGNRKWQIVGLPFGDQTVTLLTDPEDAFYAAARYCSDKVIADFTYYSEGPGPISWDGGCALLQVDEWLVYSLQGDKQGDDRVALVSENLVPIVAEWLQENHAANTFILNYSKCGWRDEAKIEGLRETLSELEEIAALNLNLKPREFDEVLGILLKSPSNRELASILEAPTAEFADPLISILQAAVTSQRSGTIIYSEALSKDVRNFGRESGE